MAKLHSSDFFSANIIPPFQSLSVNLDYNICITKRVQWLQEYIYVRKSFDSKTNLRNFKVFHRTFQLKSHRQLPKLSVWGMFKKLHHEAWTSGKSAPKLEIRSRGFGAAAWFRAEATLKTGRFFVAVRLMIVQAERGSRMYHGQDRMAQVVVISWAYRSPCDPLIMSRYIAGTAVHDGRRPQSSSIPVTLRFRRPQTNFFI